MRPKKAKAIVTNYCSTKKGNATSVKKLVYILKVMLEKAMSFFDQNSNEGSPFILKFMTSSDYKFMRRNSKVFAEIFH